MLYIEKNPEIITAFSYLEEEEPEWFTDLKKKNIVSISNGKVMIETWCGTTALSKGDYVCCHPNTDRIWVMNKNSFDIRYKPLDTV